MEFLDSIRRAVRVTPADDSDQTYDGIRNADGSAGDIRITFTDDTVFTFANVPSGKEIKCNVKKIWATGTTVTNVDGLFYR
jgi:hypothetical protein